jgi:hypothetical protein
LLEWNSLDKKLCCTILCAGCNAWPPILLATYRIHCRHDWVRLISKSLRIFPRALRVIYGTRRQGGLGLIYAGDQVVLRLSPWRLRLRLRLGHQTKESGWFLRPNNTPLSTSTAKKSKMGRGPEAHLAFVTTAGVAPPPFTLPLKC